MAGTDPPSPAARDPARPTVLLVDDEADILESVADVIRLALPGYDVLTASGGPAALEILAKRRVDVILSDQRMPGMSGMEFLKRCAEEMPDAGRVLMTAYPELPLAIQALNESHIQRFLQKPLDADEVVDLVRELANRSRADRQRAAAFDRSLSLLKERLGTEPLERTDGP